jgi:hypothetical protein
VGLATAGSGAAALSLRGGAVGAGDGDGDGARAVSLGVGGVPAGALASGAVGPAGRGSLRTPNQVTTAAKAATPRTAMAVLPCRGRIRIPQTSKAGTLPHASRLPAHKLR